MDYRYQSTPAVPPLEAWVDAETVAQHLNFSPQQVRLMAREGRIPGVQQGNGKRAFWRFKLSQVDAAMEAAATMRKAMPVLSSIADMNINTTNV